MPKSNDPLYNLIDQLFGPEINSAEIIETIAKEWHAHFDVQKVAQHDRPEAFRLAIRDRLARDMHSIRAPKGSSLL